MENTKHTPGPWAVRLHAPPTYRTTICAQYHGGAPLPLACMIEKANPADAALMAAAPVMLSVLVAVAEHFEAKEYPQGMGPGVHENSVLDEVYDAIALARAQGET